VYNKIILCNFMSYLVNIYLVNIYLDNICLLICKLRSFMNYIKKLIIIIKIINVLNEKYL
jgi:hypothetical protein